jgi:STE24 endopeptidase
MHSQAWTLIFTAAVCAAFLTRVWLASRQMRHVALHRDQVPAAFRSVISLSAHQLAADYTIAKLRFGLITLAVELAVLIAWTLLGGLNALNHGVQSLLPAATGPIAYGLALFAAFAVVSGVLDLPFAAWNTFRIEQRFGFNKMSWRLWLQDLLKGAAVGAVLGLPIAALVLWLMGRAGAWWWLWAWGVWMGFNLLMLVVYPTLIAPLFNKFQPLADEALGQRVRALMQRCGFSAKGFFVMDGSRRSAHANAYFTGLGASKRVVFFDTLLAKLSNPEVEAVLAHELGHFKRRHVVKRMAAIFAISLLGFALLGWLMQQVWFYQGLGVQPNLDRPNHALAILLLGLSAPAFLFFVSPVFAAVSRRHEFEADAYACAHSSGRDLAAALLKLYEDNASTLTPDPLYARFYYSHPPASERLAAMGAL